jgi:hypothetical protein
MNIPNKDISPELAEFFKHEFSPSPKEVNKTKEKPVSQEWKTGFLKGFVLRLNELAD